jgi:hypothetical protein
VRPKTTLARGVPGSPFACHFWMLDLHQRGPLCLDRNRGPVGSIYPAVHPADESGEGSATAAAAVPAASGASAEHAPGVPTAFNPIDALWLVGAVRGKVAGGFQCTKQGADRWQAPCPFLLPGPPCPAFRVEPASVKPTCDRANPPCGHNKMPSLRRAVAARGACRRW